jgi:hypothetical protein
MPLVGRIRGVVRTADGAIVDVPVVEQAHAILRSVVSAGASS